MLRKTTLVILFSIIILPAHIFADSPLTSTSFHDKYTDVDIVLRSEQTGIMDKEIADYLHEESNPTDIKAAVINALVWNFDGKNNAEIYSELVFDRQVTNSDLGNLNGNDLFVLGYLKAMDDYFDVSGALPFLKQARRRNKESYTVNIILALARAQSVMDQDFCKSWKYVNKVFSNENLKPDMREDARKIIYDYMVLYKGDCN